VEQEIAALAASAAAALVQMMTSDAWEQAKTSIVSLWRRTRPAQADSVGAELDAARLELLAAEEAHGERPGAGLVDEWAARLLDLATAEPLAAAILPDLAEALRRYPAGPEMTPVVSVEMRAKASGQGRVFQAGRDQKITER
jgi:hypothetical protein